MDQGNCPLGELRGQPTISMLGDTFRLSYAENEGAFLGDFADFPQPFKDILLIWLPYLAIGWALVWILFS